MVADVMCVCGVWKRLILVCRKGGRRRLASSSWTAGNMCRILDAEPLECGVLVEPW